jgi:hypothetical protein
LWRVKGDKELGDQAISDQVIRKFEKRALVFIPALSISQEISILLKEKWRRMRLCE